MRVLLLICFVFLSRCLLAQESLLNNCKVSLSFAKFLADEGGFKQSLRVLAELPDSCQNDSTLLQQIVLCKRTQDYTRILGMTPLYIARMKDDSLKLKAFLQYANARYMCGEFLTEAELTAASFLPQEVHVLLQESNCILRFEKTSTCYAPLNQEWVAKKKALQFKSPAKAALLSVILPGAGKAYCGLKRDAVRSFLMVALTSLQAYRGFSERGTKSIYGWFSAGFAVSFYSGSIYGSAKSAKKYNQQKKNAFTQEYLNHYFRY